MVLNPNHDFAMIFAMMLEEGVYLKLQKVSSWYLCYSRGRPGRPQADGRRSPSVCGTGRKQPPEA